MTMLREVEKRSKFEALQAASRNLENRLLISGRPESGHQRLQEIEKRFQSCSASKQLDDQNHSSLNISREQQDKRFHHERIINISPFESQQQQQQPEPRGKYDADMERARTMLRNNHKRDIKSVNERLVEKLVDKLPKATQTNLPPPLSSMCQSPVPKPVSVRQDSNVSSDSFSQTSSPSYTSKTMEAPLLPHKHINGKMPGEQVIFYFVISFTLNVFMLFVLFLPSHFQVGLSLQKLIIYRAVLLQSR